MPTPHAETRSGDAIREALWAEAATNEPDFRRRQAAQQELERLLAAEAQVEALTAEVESAHNAKRGWIKMFERSNAQVEALTEALRAYDEVVGLRGARPDDPALKRATRLSRAALARLHEDTGPPTYGMPPDLVRVLRDPTIVLARDHEVRLADGRTLHEHLEEWRNAPSDTMSAHLPEGTGPPAEETT